MKSQWWDKNFIRWKTGWVGGGGGSRGEEGGGGRGGEVLRLLQWVKSDD